MSPTTKTTTQTLSAEFIGWAEQAGRTLAFHDEAWFLTDSVGELYDIIRWADDRFVLARVDRNSEPAFMMSAADITDIEKHLTCHYGADIRLANNHPFIYYAWERHGIKPGWKVHSFPSQWILFNPDGHFQAVFAGKLAIRYSWIADLPIGDIRDSYLDRDGLPLFPHHWIGPVAPPESNLHIFPTPVHIDSIQ